MGRWVEASLLLGVLVLPIAVAEVPGENLGRITEQVDVRRISWPVFFESRAADGAACEILDVDQIVLTEDGERREILDVDRAREKTLHSIVIDNSLGMAPRIDKVKRAARRYVSQLPAGEPAAVFSFSGSLRMLSPPTLDKEALERAVESAELSAFTALYDALDELRSWLHSRPGKKVIVLLTDGQDNQSRPGRTCDSVVEGLASTPNLTLFIVGLDIPDKGAPNAPAPKVCLDRLARAGGGRFFDLDRVHELPRVFAAVRENLGRRRYLTYVPRPFGQGPKDRPAKKDHRWRRVKVRSPRRAPCRAVSAGPELRLETSAPTRLRGLPVARGPARKAGMIEALTWQVSPPWRLEEESPAVLAAYSSPRRLLGDLPDLVLERGPLYQQQRYWSRGRCLLDLDRPPVVARRTVEIPAPSFEEIASAGGSSEAVLESLLSLESVIDLESPAASPVREPFFVHGSLFFEIRPYLSQLFFAALPDYATFLSSKVENELSRSLPEQVPDWQELSHPQQQAVLKAWHERLARRGAADLEQHLGCWLGDVSARKVADNLDRRWSDQLLATDLSGEARLRERITSLAPAWRRLPRWFPPANRARTLLALWPAYSAERECIGFFRIVLPQPRVRGKPPPPLPDAPLGALSLAWLLEDAAMRPELQGRTLLSMITRPQEHAVVLGLVPAGPRQAKLLLSARGSKEPSLEVTVRFLRGSRPSDPAHRPGCASVNPLSTAGGSGGATARKLNRLLSEGGRRCR